MLSMAALKERRKQLVDEANAACDKAVAAAQAAGGTSRDEARAQNNFDARIEEVDGSTGRSATSGTPCSTRRSA